MDTTKWKSVLLPRDVYAEVMVIAKLEGRTISGQLRKCFEHWKKEHLGLLDQRRIADHVAEFKSEKDEALTSKSFNPRTQGAVLGLERRLGDR